jgi:hypothetical protein
VHVELALVFKDPDVTGAIFIAILWASSEWKNDAQIMGLISNRRGRPSIRVPGLLRDQMDTCHEQRTHQQWSQNARSARHIRFLSVRYRIGLMKSFVHASPDADASPELDG